MARLLLEAQATWANSSGANTTKDIDIPGDGDVGGKADVLIEVRNPSAVTALTVTAKDKELAGTAFGGGSTRYVQVAKFAAGVPVNTPEAISLVVKDWDLGGGGRVTLSNDTILGGADGFTADVRVKVTD
jgi:hypothetical protein